MILQRNHSDRLETVLVFLCIKMSSLCMLFMFFRERKQVCNGGGGEERSEHFLAQSNNLLLKESLHKQIFDACD